MNTQMSPFEEPRNQTPKPEREGFQLSTGWVLVGLIAVALGLVCGLVMSSATFLR